MFLPNFPMVSQLTSVTSDGRVSENAQMDCVAAAIGAAILWYQGKTEWDETVNPDRLKDAVYGEAYTGGTAARDYVNFCRSLGFSLWAFKGEPAVLVNEAHKQLVAGHPVIFTEPDPYVSATLGWSHVDVFYGETGTGSGLVALDPYIAKPVSRWDTEWEARLQYNEIWILEKEEPVPLPLDITIPIVANYFVLQGATTWVCKQTGRIIYGEILGYYRTMGATPLHGLDDLGLPKTNEIPIENLPYIGNKFAAIGGRGITVQFFELGPVLFDPSNLIDHRPGGGRVYRAKPYDGGPGTDWKIGELSALIGQLQAEIGKLKSEPVPEPVPSPEVLAEHDAIVQIKQIVGPL